MFFRWEFKATKTEKPSLLEGLFRGRPVLSYNCPGVNGGCDKVTLWRMKKFAVCLLVCLFTEFIYRAR